MTVTMLYQELLGVLPGFGEDKAGIKRHIVNAVRPGLAAELTISFRLWQVAYILGVGHS